MSADLSWAAGLFEGEGTVCLHGAGCRGYTILCACVTNTDHDILAEFAGIWPVGLTIVRRRDPNHRDAGEWRLRGGSAAAFLQEIRPHVRSTRMKVRIALALEYDARRRQGSRDPDYRPMGKRYAAAMRLLNGKGADALDPAFLAHLLNEQTGMTIYQQLVEDGRVELAAPLRPALMPGSP